MPPTPTAATDPRRNIAGWLSLSCVLPAPGAVLWFLATHDLMALFELRAPDDPLLTAALVLGIAGVLAAIVALVRKEAKELALLGLGIGLSVVLAKFILGALLLCLLVSVVVAFVLDGG